MTALIACVLPRAGASAAPQLMPDPPLVPAEDDAAREAKTSTLRELADRKQQRRARAAKAKDADRLLDTAAAQIGDGYAMGGSGPDAFDCSGLTAFVFAEAGVALPHNSHAQAVLGRPVARDDIRPGDVVFFSTAGPGASHVGIATGEDTAISATNSGVMEHSLSDAYWGGNYVGARRIR
jgi:cell wall-associated NlpC family hydrolase